MKREVNSVPGVYQMPIDTIVHECAKVYSLGIIAVILFGIIERKDEVGSKACDDNGKAIDYDSAKT